MIEAMIIDECAFVFQGPTKFPNDIRWVGNEGGGAPYDNWSAAQSSQDYGGGAPDAPTWAPAEADTCIRTASGHSSLPLARIIHIILDAL